MRSIEPMPPFAAVEHGGPFQQLKPRQIGIPDLHGQPGTGIHVPAVQRDAVVAHAFGRDQCVAGHALLHRDGIHVIEVEQYRHPFFPCPTDRAWRMYNNPAVFGEFLF